MSETVIGIVLVLGAVTVVQMLGAHVGQEMAQAVEVMLALTR